VKSTLSRRPQILSPCICNASQAPTLITAGQWSPVELFSFDFWTILLTRCGLQSPQSNSLVARISSLAGGRPKLFPKAPHLSRSSARALRESTKWSVQATQTTTPARSVTGSGLASNHCRVSWLIHLLVLTSGPLVPHVIALDEDSGRMRESWRTQGKQSKSGKS
jgi:hypothetical protein